MKFLESFDIDLANMSRKYENVSGSFISTTGRLQGLALAAAGEIFRTPSMGNHGTWIVGIAVKPQTLSAEQKWVTIQDGTNEQISLWFVAGTAGKTKIRVKRGSTTLGTTANEWTNGFWIYVEFKVVLDTDGSNGSYEVKVNEISELSGSGTDTTNHGSSVANTVQFSATESGTDGWLLDDIYICDGAGSKNNNFLGDTSVEGKSPTANGNRNQWIVGSGASAHWTYVDETQVDEDTTFLYVLNNSDGQVELFEFADITQIAGTVHGVQLTFAARMNSSGSDNLRAIFRNGAGSEATGSDKLVNKIDGYQWYQEIYENDPVAAAAWTVSSFNAMQIGLESRP